MKYYSQKKIYPRKSLRWGRNRHNWVNGKQRLLAARKKIVQFIETTLSHSSFLQMIQVSNKAHKTLTTAVRWVWNPLAKTPICNKSKVFHHRVNRWTTFKPFTRLGLKLTNKQEIDARLISYNSKTTLSFKVENTNLQRATISQKPEGITSNLHSQSAIILK
jgi:hypothetical protein